MKTKVASSVDASVGSRIKALRRAARMSQERLAERLGVTFQQVQKYERGVNRVSASRLWDIAQALGVTSDRLFEALIRDWQVGGSRCPAMNGGNSETRWVASRASISDGCSWT